MLDIDSMDYVIVITMGIVVVPLFSVIVQYGIQLMYLSSVAMVVGFSNFLAQLFGIIISLELSIFGVIIKPRA